MRILITIFFAIINLITLVGQDAVTWSEDVACIIYNKCSGCHNPEGIAPFSLLSYQDAFNNRANIKWAVETKFMPPWRAERGHTAFRNDMSLTDEQIQTIVDWVNNDAPEGNPDVAPDAPTEFVTEAIPDPDVVIEFEEYTSQAVDEDDFRCFVEPWGEMEQKWIIGSEVQPGNTNIVHHSLYGWDAENTVVILDEEDPGPGYYCFGGFGSNSVNLIGGWVPGGSANIAPEGFGFSIPGGGHIVMQTHYPEGSSGEKDATSIRFKFADPDAEIRGVNAVPILNHFSNLTDGPLWIPANTIKTFHARQVIPADIVLLAVSPHAHLIARSMNAYAVTPMGDTLDIINIPKWDFDWQLNYTFKKPIVVPSGSIIYGAITYDNTTNNERNPSNPPVDVSVGEETTDEMFLFFFGVSLYQSGDEDLEFKDDAPVVDCIVSSTTTEVGLEHISIAPNPSSDYILIDSDTPLKTSIRLMDINGRQLYNQQEVLLPTKIHLPRLSDGVYLLRLTNHDTQVSRRIIVRRN